MYNQCNFMGRLVADPKRGVTPKGTNFCHFSLAIPVGKNAASEKTADFFEFEAWKETCDLITSHLKKGDRIVVTARAVQQKYVDQFFEKRSAVKFVVRQFYFADGITPEDSSIDIDDEDTIPFE